jgi:hypothetical protein
VAEADNVLQRGSLFEPLRQRADVLLLFQCRAKLRESTRAAARGAMPVACGWIALG